MKEREYMLYLEPDCYLIRHCTEVQIVPIAIHGLPVVAGYLQLPLPLVGTEGHQRFAGLSHPIANLQEQSLAYSMCFAAWKIEIILHTCK